MPTPPSPARPPSSSLSSRTDWSHLASDIKFYLDYYLENITHFHYGLVHDRDQFLGRPLLALAVDNPVLLHAVASFSAYHHAHRVGDGNIQKFLDYYNESISLLLSILTAKGTPALATLLAILQLATVEEYIGDSTYLIRHQRAAFKIITQILTPQSAVRTSEGRMTLCWYARLDIVAAHMVGADPLLSHEWLSSLISHHQAVVLDEPDNVSPKLEEREAQLKLIFLDMSKLYAKRNRGEIPPGDWTAECDFIRDRLRDWKHDWHPSLTNVEHAVADLSSTARHTDEQPPYQDKGILYNFPLFTGSILTCVWHAFTIMHVINGYHLPAGRKHEGDADLKAHAAAISQILDAVQDWSYAPEGVAASLEICLLTVAIVFRDEPKHRLWLRRKFASLELRCGYTWSRMTRIHLAGMFQDPSCERWWLPNGEGSNATSQAIRDLAEDRHQQDIARQTANASPREQAREIEP